MAMTSSGTAWVLSQFTDQPQTGPTLPMHLALVTEQGDADNAGTEVGGDNYERQEVTLETSNDGGLTNAGAVAFSEADGFVVGWEVWDDADVRWWFGPLLDEQGNEVSVQLSPGYRIEFAAGELTLDADNG